MEPQIRYAKTADGVNIAWYSVGEGLPFVWLPYGPYTHTQYEWTIAETREVLETLAQRVQLVRYDTRGFSLSDRGPFDYSLESMVLDLEAVVDAGRLSRFVLHAPLAVFMPAILFASRHPQSVIAVLSTGACSSGSDLTNKANYQSTLRLARENWEFARGSSILSQAGGWSETATIHQLASMLDASASHESFLSWYEAIAGWDVRDVLPQIAVPVLVANDNSGNNVVTAEETRRVATSIPSATFHIVPPGRSSWTDVAAKFIADVISGGSTPQPQSPPESGLRTILFTDLVGHTEMMQRLGDDRGRDVLREHERITRELLKQYGGAEAKTMGDGFMASFTSVTKAMDCAIALQRAFAAHEGEPLQVRVGLNAGEPIEEDGDLFGSTVIMASRIAAQAGAGEILIPEPLRHLLTGKSYVYADRGETMLKGFEDAVRLYEVRWRA
jgi:class 3 adenylate cyclase/pimeloyl-ACP methyl ester carboxylesterase